MRTLLLALATPGLVIAALSAWPPAGETEVERQQNMPARALGFANADDLAKATAAGITDPAVWRAQVEHQRETANLEKRRREAEQAEIRREMTRNPASKMLLTNFTWKVSGFGSVAILSFTVQNDNDFAVKDMEIACSLSAASGTSLSSISHTIFDTVKAKSKRTFKDINAGLIHSQSKGARCWVESAGRL